MKKLILSYCQENQPVADKIVLALSANVEIYRVAMYQDKGVEQLTKAVKENEDVALLLISDNFLKSEVCMKDALRVVQELSIQKRLIPIVTDGVYPKNGSSTEYITTPTSFERVSNVIQYMNFWQDYYLSLRRSKTEGAEEAQFAEKVRSVRSISSEVGELLRFLRSVDYWTFEQLSASHYAPVWKYLGISVPSTIPVAEDEPVVADAVDSQTHVPEEKREIMAPASVDFSPSQSSPQGNSAFSPVKEKEVTLDSGIFAERKHGFTSTLEDMKEEMQTVEAPEASIKAINTNDVPLTSGIDQYTYRNSPSTIVNENPENGELIIGSEKYIPTDSFTDHSESTKPGKKEELTLEDHLDIVNEQNLLHFIEEKKQDIPAVDLNPGAPAKDSINGVEQPPSVQAIPASAVIEVASIEAPVHTERTPGTGENVEPASISSIETLRQKLEKDPGNQELRFQYAAQLSQENKFTEASEQLTTLLERDKNNVDAYLLLAYIAEHNNDFLLSQSLLEKVASIQPDYPGIYYKLATLTKEHFKGQGKKAARYFREAFTRDKGNADAHYQYAIIKLEQSGNYEKAIRHLSKAIQLKPNHPQAHFDLAVAYYEQGNKPQAFHHYQRAAENDPVFKTKINDEIFHFDPPKTELADPDELRKGELDNGRVVLITGATSGIGLATADIFARNGFRLILTGRRNDRLTELKQNFEKKYRNKVHLLNFDVRNLEEVTKSIAALDENWRNVDILINNAGLALGLGPIHEGDVEDWDTMIDTNIKGLLYMTRAVAPLMVARRKGHIINISSIAGKEVYPNGNVYAATKHAVEALTKAMRIDLFKHNVRVSQVAPGMVEETEFALVRFHGDAGKAKIYEDFKPLKAEDVAEIIYFMASRPGHINVQDVLVMSTQQGSAALVDRSGRG